jgi:hypothetical protein
MQTCGNVGGRESALLRAEECEAYTQTMLSCLDACCKASRKCELHRAEVLGDDEALTVRSCSLKFSILHVSAHVALFRLRNLSLHFGWYSVDLTAQRSAAGTARGTLAPTLLARRFRSAGARS